MFVPTNHVTATTIYGAKSLVLWFKETCTTRVEQTSLGKGLLRNKKTALEQRAPLQKMYLSRPQAIQRDYA